MVAGATHRSYLLAEVPAELAASVVLEVLEELAVLAVRVELVELVELAAPAERVELEELAGLVVPVASAGLVVPVELVALVASGSTTRSIAVAPHIRIVLQRTALVVRLAATRWLIARLVLVNKSEDKAAIWPAIAAARVVLEESVVAVASAVLEVLATVVASAARVAPEESATAVGLAEQTV